MEDKDIKEIKDLITSTVSEVIKENNKSILEEIDKKIETIQTKKTEKESLKEEIMKEIQETNDKTTTKTVVKVEEPSNNDTDEDIDDEDLYSL